YGIQDLDDTVRRLQAFEKAGADVLYAPGLRTLDDMRVVVSSVSRPVNVVMGFAEPSITLPKLAEIGVRRVSIGGALPRLAPRAFLHRGAAMLPRRCAPGASTSCARTYRSMPSVQPSESQNEGDVLHPLSDRSLPA